MGDQVRTLLADEQWERIAPLALGKPGDRGVTGKNNRDFVEAVLWILRTGAPWRDLPQWFGKWPTVYKRFARWCQRGVWRRMREALRPNTPCIAVMLDSTIVRAHQHAAGGLGGREKHAIGRSRGGLTTKIHVLVSMAGAALVCVITGGNEADITHAPALLNDLRRGSIVIGDRGYDSNALVNAITHTHTDKP